VRETVNDLGNLALLQFRHQRRQTTSQTVSARLGGPFDAHVLDLAVFVLEGAEDGVDNLEADGIVEHRIGSGAEELVGKIARRHEPEIGIYRHESGQELGGGSACRLHLHAGS
jgi:hypothetical protein